MPGKILLLITIVSFLIFLLGIILCTIDIESYGSGLYISLVSVVVFLVNATACIIGMAHDDDDSTAKRMWGRIRRKISLKSNIDKDVTKNVIDKEKLLVGQENLNYINDDTEKIDLSILYENPMNSIEKLNYVDKNEVRNNNNNDEELVAVIWYENLDENESTFL
uniref:Transmembrane protein n=1 Tax=Parastrongyloides trichosuri TaxID=131310 RepID=A0A0N4ZML4_PARTI